MSGKIKIKDSLGYALSPGDILLYVSSLNWSLGQLRCGVYLNDFDNGSGRKIRIRTIGHSGSEVGDNAKIDASGFGSGIIKIEKPEDFPDIERVKVSCNLRDLMLADGRVGSGSKDSMQMEMDFGREGFAQKALSDLPIPKSIL